MKFEGVPENEFAMMKLARAIGVDVPEVRLVPLKEIAGLPEDVARMEGNALAVKHFDRTEDGRRVHVEDFAQVSCSRLRIRESAGQSLPRSCRGGGKSGLRRAGCQVTPGGRESTESAAENIPPKSAFKADR